MTKELNTFLAVMLCSVAVALAADPTTNPTTNPATEPVPINVREFGAKGDGVADDAPAINHAISVAIGGNPGAVVFIPAGRYRLEVPTGKSDHLSISRATGLTLRGETGTTLIAHDPDANIIGLFRSKSVRLSNLTLEQEKTSFSQGTITALPKSMMCDVTIDPGYDEPDSPDLATFRSLRVFTNPQTAAYQPERTFPPVKSQQRIADRKWRLALEGRALDADCIGKKFILWDNRRRGHAIAGAYDEDCVVEDVRYFGKGANTSFYLANCRGTMVFRGWITSVPPDSNGLISCAGGGEFPNMRGSLLFENCLFDRVDDDAAEILTPYVRVVALIDPHTLQLQHNPGYEPGDTLALVDWSKKAERGLAKIVAVAAKPDHACVVTLDRDVQLSRPGAGDGKPWGSEARGDGIDRVVDYNLACQSVVFRKCTMQSLRARAINLKGQNCLIEGCTFHDCEMPAVACGPEFYWGEGPAVRNLTLRDNQFRNCNTSNIDIDCFDADKECSAFDNRTILIEGNKFEQYGGHATANRYIPACAIHIKNADTVIIRNNVFGKLAPSAAKETGIVIIERSRNVTVGKNEGLPEAAVQRK